MFNSFFNKTNEKKEELAEIERKIGYSKMILLEHTKQITESEKKIKELDKQIAKREKFWIDTELKYIDNLNGLEFEKYVTELFNKLDYSAITTKASNDDGVDIIAIKDGKKYAIQCKNYSYPVGNKAIQEVYTAKGITKSDIAIVLTNHTDFTSSAVKEANALGVELWNRDKLTEMLYVIFHFNLRNIDKIKPYNIKQNNNSINETDDEEKADPFLMDAIEAVMDMGQASASYIQRKFKVGYSRAERIIEQMEKRGIISGYEGSKPRKVLIPKETWENLKNNIV